MVADLLLKILGENPAYFNEVEDKWTSILVVLTDLIVPYGQILLFLVPFAVLYLWKRKFTVMSASICALIGILLALGAYMSDQWLLGWGQAQFFYDFHGISR